MHNFESILDKLYHLGVQSANEGNDPANEIACLKNSDLLKVTLPGQLFDFTLDKTEALLGLLADVGKSHPAIGRIYEGHINALYLLHLYGTNKQRDFWYNQVLVERKLFGVWNTDAQIGISFLVHNKEVAIDGAKSFCSGSYLVDMAIIGGKSKTNEEDWLMVAVPMAEVNSSGIDRRSWEPLGMQSSISHTIDFSGILLSDFHVLGSPGDFHRQPYFFGGAIRFAAVHQGIAEAIVEHTKAYLQQLNRLDDPFQKMRLGQMVIALTSAKNWISIGGRHYDKWKNDPSKSADLVAYAHMVRLGISEACTLILELSAKSVGAKGLMKPHMLESFHRDLYYYLRQPAPDATLMKVAEHFIHTASKSNVSIAQNREIDNA